MSGEVIVRVDAEVGHGRFTGTIERDGERVDVGRWATMTWHDDWTDHLPCVAVTFSDGRRIGGEMSPDFALRRCREWVGKGR